MSAREVAHIGYSAFRAKKVISVTGFQNKALVQLVRFIPRSAVRRIINRYNKIKDQS
jgi:short-subunit dehydrogenase